MLPDMKYLNIIPKAYKIYTSRIYLLSHFKVDKLIDLAAPPPKGTGVQNIRECIIESKMTFDVSADEWQMSQNKFVQN